MSLDDLRYRCKKINLFELQLPPELKTYAQLAWTAIGKNIYSLSLTGGEAVIVAATILGKWDIIHRNKGCEENISDMEKVEDAICLAEQFIKSNRPDVMKLVKLGTKWRKEPATEKQIAIIKRKGLEIPDDLTKGQASHIIQMFSFAGTIRNGQMDVGV